MLDSLTLSIIEKITNDAGWNICKKLSPDEAEFNNSFFDTSVCIQCDAAGSFIVSFSKPVNLHEIVETAGTDQRTIEHDARIENNTIIIKDKTVLSEVLYRSAEIIYSEPDNPLVQYLKKTELEFAELSSRGEIITTDREAMVKQRVGQHTYREAQKKYWGSCCAVTGCALDSVLRASHAKPWADCESDAERLDVYNGFLLTANLDALFDKGYISFTDKGIILISSQISSKERTLLGLTSSMKLRRIQSEHIKYLIYHYNNIWKR